MTMTELTLPKDSKFKVGDKVSFEGQTWTIDGYCLTNGVGSYEISTQSGMGLYIKGVPIAKGDDYFSKA